MRSDGMATPYPSTVTEVLAEIGEASERNLVQAAGEVVLGPRLQAVMDGLYPLLARHISDRALLEIEAAVNGAVVEVGDLGLEAGYGLGRTRAVAAADPDAWPAAALAYPWLGDGSRAG
jgi:hypothetical protein